MALRSGICTALDANGTRDSPVGARAGLASGALVVGLAPSFGTPLTVHDLWHLTELSDG